MSVSSNICKVLQVMLFFQVPVQFDQSVYSTGQQKKTKQNKSFL